MPAKVRVMGLFSAMAWGSCSQLTGLRARPRAAGTPSSTAGVSGRTSGIQNRWLALSSRISSILLFWRL